MKNELYLVVKVLEDAYCDAGNAGGMGDIVSAQPSTNIGSTIGAAYTNGGGTIGSGDVSVGFNKKPFQKTPTKGKKNKLKKLFQIQQNYQHGEDKPKRILDWKTFSNKVTHLKK